MSKVKSRKIADTVMYQYTLRVQELVDLHELRFQIGSDEGLMLKRLHFYIYDDSIQDENGNSKLLYTTKVLLECLTYLEGYHEAISVVDDGVTESLSDDGTITWEKF